MPAQIGSIGAGLAPPLWIANAENMIPQAVAQTALALPEDERLELARQLIASVVTESNLNELVAEGMQRIEDVARGKVLPLAEEQFRAALR